MTLLASLWDAFVVGPCRAPGFKAHGSYYQDSRAELSAAREHA